MTHRRRARFEWAHLLDYTDFRLSADPTRDLRTWCEWRVDLNNAMCREGRVPKAERMKELIKKTNKREQKYLTPHADTGRRSRPALEQFLLANFGLPRVSKVPEPTQLMPQLIILPRPGSRADFH